MIWGSHQSERDSAPSWNWPLIIGASLGVVGLLVVAAIPLVRLAIDDLNKKSAIQNGSRIARAIHEASLKRFPVAFSVDRKGRPLLSWRVHILPYLGKDDLYQQFRLGEPWDSPHNSSLIAAMPAVYENPGLSLPAGHTCWLATVGERSVIVKPSYDPLERAHRLGIRSGDIPDGTSKTFLFVEVDPAAAVPWTAPADYEYDLAQPLRNLGNGRPDRFIMVYADGHVEYIPTTISDDIMRGLYQRDDFSKLPEVIWMNSVDEE